MRRLLAVVAGLALALAGSPALAADTTGAVDPATARWELRDAGGDTLAFTYGNPGDVPFMGDWDCDGIDTPGLYRQSDGFVYLRNSNSTGIADVEFFFGDPGDEPLAGDFDGDGCDTVSVYRDGRVFVVNQLGEDQGGLGAADFAFTFGNPGDAPFVADFDGDGADEVGLRRESTGFAYLRFTLDTGIADLEFFYGDPGDVVTAGDWDGDGDGTVGIFRPFNRRFFLNDRNGPGAADREVPGGACGWLPVAGEFGDLPASPGPALDTFATGLAPPVFLDAPPGDGRVFVALRDGRIVTLGGCPPTTTTYLDLRDRILSGGERGLLGLAFHPDFAANQRLFVNYTDRNGDTVISEFTGNDPAGERVVLRVAQPASNHNGGMLAFGTDGFLYIGMGDGGGGGDPFGNGQDVRTLLGAILRIGVDGRQPYAIPAGNPFAGGGGRAEIWVYGARNPWRFSFDPATGLLYAGDVGQDAWEEVDVLGPGDAGANLGWPIMEGAHCFPPGTACNRAGLKLPAIEYDHDVGCSITGGYVYRGEAAPELAGEYLYGDFCSGRLFGYRHDTGAARELTGLLGAVPRLASFGTDGYGELYLLTLDGRVLRVVPAG